AAAVLIIALFLRRGEPVVYVAAVQEYSGRVLVGPAGVPLQPVREMQRLTPGDEIVTGDEGRVLLSFGDGAATMEIFPESKFRIEEVTREDGALRELVIRCQAGAMQTHVQEGVALTMHAYGNQLSTTGATFRISYLPDFATALEVIEGQVRVENQGGSAPFEAGDSTLLWAQTPPGEPLDFPLRFVEPDNTEGQGAGPRFPWMDDYYGVIRAVPEGESDVWVIGDRLLTTMPDIRLEEQEGPLQVGACAEVKLYDDGNVERIRTAESRRCEEKPDDE
ncbi:MAG: hypothetical protein ACREQ3_26875, partial [Candidatus Binatia bacterium]